MARAGHHRQILLKYLYRNHGTYHGDYAWDYRGYGDYRGYRDYKDYGVMSHLPNGTSQARAGLNERKLSAVGFLREIFTSF